MMSRPRYIFSHFVFLILFGVLSAYAAVNSQKNHVVSPVVTVDSFFVLPSPDSPQKYFHQQHYTFPVSRSDGFSKALIKGTLVIEPVSASYLPVNPTVTSFTRRLYTRYLPRDPTL